MDTGANRAANVETAIWGPIALLSKGYWFLINAFQPPSFDKTAYKLSLTKKKPVKVVPGYKWLIHARVGADITFITAVKMIPIDMIPHDRQWSLEKPVRDKTGGDVPFLPIKWKTTCPGTLHQSESYVLFPPFTFGENDLGGGMVEACLNKNLPVHMPLPSLYFHQVSFSRVQEKIEWSRVPTTQGVGPVPQRFQPFPNVPGFRPWMYTFTSTTGSVGHWQKKGTHTHTHIHRMGVYGHMWIYTRRHAQMHVQKVNV